MSNEMSDPNIFGPYNERIYAALLQKLRFPKMSIEEKLNRLENNLPEHRYKRLVKEISKTMDDGGDEMNNKIDIVLQQYSKFNGGISYLIKTRKLDINKYNNAMHTNYLPESFIDHVGLFFNTKNTMYHYLPDGVKFGTPECDKEESSYDWAIHELNTHGSFFTLMTFDEINMFVTRWMEVFKYNHNLRSSELFGYTLAYWLM